jgi:MFS family permease
VRLLELPRSVWLLGWVSFATDAATEAVYPLLPFFLTQVLGASAISLGLVEGAAEAANSALKILSGRAADRARRRRPIVLLGYTISSLARPLIAAAQTWTQVFTVRIADRVGKGIRGAPRDAMLATWASATTRGKVYGFHRAMDHAGAVVGPILASVFLLAWPAEYRTLFALTIIPGAIAVALIFFVREDIATEIGGQQHGRERLRPCEPEDKRIRGRASSSERAGGARLRRGYGGSAVARMKCMSGGWRAPAQVERKLAEPPRLSRELNGFLVVLTLFTLGNSTDAFLLLKLTDAAGSTAWIPMIWAALHVVKASVSVVAGTWSDRVGRRSVIAIGWIVYAIVYAGFAVVDDLVPLLALFLLYGLYFGFTEGAEKALIADLAPVSRRGFAFGVYNAVLGAGGLAASVLFGYLWTAFGPIVAFGAGAVLALAATALLFVTVSR